jgi:hypothetical protein
MTRQTNEPPTPGSQHVHINSLSAAGHVTIAQGNVTIIGGTRGNSSDNDIITIGGVEATQEEVAQLHTSLDRIDHAIETAQLDASAQAAAQTNAATLRQQVTSPTPPNEYLLVQAAEALFHFGPDIAGAVVAAFTTPLVGKIVQLAGERALRFYRQLRNPDATAASVPPPASAPANTAPAMPTDIILPGEG